MKIRKEADPPMKGIDKELSKPFEFFEKQMFGININKLH